jgi:hypothetical protein
MKKLLFALAAISMSAHAGWSGPDISTVLRVDISSTAAIITLIPATGTPPSLCPSGDTYLTVLRTDPQYGAVLAIALLAKDLSVQVQTYGENAAGTSCRPVQFVLKRATP